MTRTEGSQKVTLCVTLYDNFVLRARNQENIENRGTQVAVEKDVLSEARGAAVKSCQGHVHTDSLNVRFGWLSDFGRDG